VDDVYKIRAAFPKALDPPMLGDKYPNAAYGVTDAGRMLIMASVQTVTKGKSDPSVLYAWWPKTQKEFDKLVVQSAVGGGTNPVYWLKR